MITSINKLPSDWNTKQRQSEEAARRVQSMLQRKQSLERMFKGLILTVVVLLLVSVVQGCCTVCPPVSQPTVFRPPSEIMQPVPTQYLLPENQQRKVRKVTS